MTLADIVGSPALRVGKEAYPPSNGVTADADVVYTAPGDYSAVFLDLRIDITPDSTGTYMYGLFVRCHIDVIDPREVNCDAALSIGGSGNPGMST